jgi:hypothetical protein
MMAAGFILHCENARKKYPTTRTGPGISDWHLWVADSRREINNEATKEQSFLFRASPEIGMDFRRRQI